jgi:ubiquinone/menaquinone biosynthesis C-methylase UbiE
MKWIRKSSLEPLAVSMPGVKLGDRLLVIGCSDPMLIAGLASKAGLTGRACAVDDDESLAIDAGRIAEREGALVETARAPDWNVPYENSSFDVVVLRSMLPEAGSRPPAVREAIRVLRPGGRCVSIDGETRRGLGAFIGTKTETPDASESTGALTAAGFLAVRVLAEREGMVFLEGVKRNT